MRIAQRGGTIARGDELLKAIGSILVATTLTAGVSCSTSPAEDAALADSAPSPGPAADSAPSPVLSADSSSSTSSGTGGAYIPTLVQQTDPPGATSVEVTPKIGFRLVGVSAPEGPSVAATAAAHLQFVDGAGQMVVADGRFFPEQPVDLPAEFWPKTPLAPDAWYWMVADANPEVLLVTQSDTFGLQSGVPRRFESRFFTGSAPHIIDISLEPDKSGRVAEARILFSEPVLASSLAGGLGVELGETPAAGCVSLGNDGCVTQASQMDVQVVLFRFEAPIDPAAATSLSLHLEGSVRGSARTVAEGNVAAGFPGTAQDLRPSFKACGGSMSYCWHEPQDPAPRGAP